MFPGLFTQVWQWLAGMLAGQAGLPDGFEPPKQTIDDGGAIDPNG